jgi:hypothetical protein
MVKEHRQRITIQSAKAKGRGLQQWVCQQLSDLFGIPWGKDELIASREMGQSGVDVRLIGEAADRFPWDVECKAQESWSVHDWVEQARRNSTKEGRDWVVIAKRSRQNPVAILDAEVFLRLAAEHRHNEWAQLLDKRLAGE